jgi:hypothetical protein
MNGPLTISSLSQPEIDAVQKMFVTLACLLCAACATLPGDPANMTPAQLKANAKDKNAAVACSSGKTAAGNVTLVYVNMDQAVRLGSQATVEADCKTTITTTSIPAPALAASAP